MHLATTVFPQFLSAGTTIFIACQDAGTIWGQGQCHYTVKCMQSRVLACEHSATATTCAPQRVIVTDLMILRCMHTVFYLQYRAVLFARKERGCLGRDVWCGVSCHPSKLMQCTVLCAIFLNGNTTNLEGVDITTVATDFQAFFIHWRQKSLSGALRLPAACACSARYIRGRV